MPARFRVNRPKIVAKDDGGEVLLLNLGTGQFYSLLGSAAGIWGSIERGADAEGIVSGLRERYDGVPEGIEETAAAFVDELVQEGLVMIAGEGDEPEPEPEESGAAAEPPRREGRFGSWFLGTHDEQSEVPPSEPQVETYSPPRLERFEHLEEMIFLGADSASGSGD